MLLIDMTPPGGGASGAAGADDVGSCRGKPVPGTQKSCAAIYSAADRAQCAVTSAARSRQP
jgi:hypothetical protein